MQLYVTLKNKSSSTQAIDYLHVEIEQVEGGVQKVCLATSEATAKIVCKSVSHVVVSEPATCISSHRYMPEFRD